MPTSTLAVRDILRAVSVDLSRVGGEDSKEIPPDPGVIESARESELTESEVVDRPKSNPALGLLDLDRELLLKTSGILNILLLLLCFVSSSSTERWSTGVKRFGSFGRRGNRFT